MPDLSYKITTAAELEANQKTTSLAPSIQSGSIANVHHKPHLRFGAPLHLTATQLVDLMRVSRFRVPSLDISYLFGGPLSSGGGGTVHHPRKTHAANSETATGRAIKLIVAASDNPLGENDPNRKGIISLDATPPSDDEEAPSISLSLADIVANGG